jgi:hypothetical protein
MHATIFSSDAVLLSYFAIAGGGLGEGTFLRERIFGKFLFNGGGGGFAFSGQGERKNKNWIVQRPGAIRSEVGTADMKFVT